MKKYINLDLKNFNTGELKQISKECELLKNKISEMLIKNTSNFEEKFKMWVEYGVKEDISYATYLCKELQEFIDSEICKDRYETIELDYILDLLSNKLEDEEIDEEEYNNLRKLLMKENFGSVVWDW